MKLGLIGILIYWYFIDLCLLAHWLFGRLRRPRARVPTNAMVFPRS